MASQSRMVSFNVEVLTVMDNRRLGIIKPDRDGYYNNMPIAVLGASSRQRTFYRPEKFAEQINSPNTYIGIALRDGSLYGEYGHPDLSIYKTKEEMLIRLSKVDEKTHSHHFRRIKTDDKLLENGGTIVIADLKPTGPYGKQLKESLDEKYMNTSLSLRAITDDTMENGLICRDTSKLITFDYVLIGGFKEASKRFNESGSKVTISEEGYSVDISDVISSASKNSVRFASFALETFTDTELSEVFGSTVTRQTLRNSFITSEDPEEIKKIVKMSTEERYTKMFCI